MSVNPDDLLPQAIAAARAGQKEEARQLLVQVLRANPRSEAGWLWMSAVVDTRAERVHCLKQVLAINPASEMARRGLEALGALDAAQPAAPPSPAPHDAPPAPHGVPLVGPEAVARAQREAEAVLAALREEEQRAGPAAVWAAPEALSQRGRARLGVHPGPMVFVVMGSVALVAAVVILVSLLSGALRPQETAVAGVTPSPVPTATATPEDAPTPRPTRTPAPSALLDVSEPSLPVVDAPRGDLRFGLTPTAPYVLTPHPSNRTVEEVAAAFYAGRYEEALTLAEQARAGGEPPPDLGYFEAASLLQLGETARAVRLAEQGVAQESDFAPLHVVLAEGYTRQGSFERARVAAERARSLDPRLIAGYIALAELYLEQGNYDAALTEVEAGRIVRKYDVNLLVLASRIHLARGDAENATAYANLAYYIDPGAEPVALALARGRLALDFNERAIIGLEDFLNEVNPSSAEAWALLGQAYGRQGRAADAQMAYARALQLSGDASLALAERGRLYLAQGRYREAYDDLTAALEVLGSEPELRLDHARAAFAVGAYRETLDDLDALRSEDGALEPELEVFAVRALAGQGRYEEAIERATALLAEALVLALDDAQQAYLFESRARAYYALERLDEARADIEQALNLGETGSRRYQRALILIAQGEEDQAARDLEWVLFWDRTFAYPFAADAAARLAELEAARPTPTPRP